MEMNFKMYSSLIKLIYINTFSVIHKWKMNKYLHKDFVKQRVKEFYWNCLIVLIGLREEMVKVW